MVLPSGIVTTGWPSVRDVSAHVGILYDDWQRDLNIAILGKSASTDYSAEIVVISICRQAGKTYDVGGLLFADCIINPNTLAVWTAHHFTVTRESFMSLKAMAEHPLMKPHVDPDAITTGAGNECIPFRNGSRILFKARESGAIRGVAKVRRLVLDEAQILTESAMADLAPTMNQADNPQVILMGTPPKPKDPSEVFRHLRDEALAGDSEGVLYVEFSADRKAQWDDRAQWRKANPSYPKRTSTKAILRLSRLLTPGDFRREGLGIWDEDGKVPAEIPGETWRDLGPMTPPAGRTVYGVKFSNDGAQVALAGAIRPESGAIFLEAIAQAPMTLGLGWLADWLAARKDRTAQIVIDGKAGAETLRKLLRDQGVSDMLILIPSVPDVVAAHSILLEAVTSATAGHSGQKLFADSVAGAGKRKIGNAGGWGWDAINGGDPLLLEAATYAHWGARVTKRRPGSGRSSGDRTNGNRRAAVT